MKLGFRLMLVWICLAIVAMCSADEGRYQIRFDGKVVGKATMRLNKNPDGSIHFESHVSMSMYGESVEWWQSSVTAKDGTPIRYSYTKIDGEDREIISASYEKDGVRVLVSAKDRSVSRMVAYPKGSIKAISETWFFHVQPKVGQKAVYWSLDYDSFKWEREEEVYRGPKRISVNGQSVVAHLITIGVEELYLGQRGLPVRLSHGPTGQSLLIERI